MAAHPADRTAYLCETAVFLRDLAELRPERPLQQAIENLALAKRRPHRDIVGLIEQRKQARPGLDQLARHRADGEARPLAPARRRADRRRRHRRNALCDPSPVRSEEHTSE